LLWNKLGATLANSNRSDDAVGVYMKALEYNPNFVRARANLGISFLALKNYEQAARQFLGALKLQPSARHLWVG
jgi:peroxin-5